METTQETTPGSRPSQQKSFARLAKIWMRNKWYEYGPLHDPRTWTGKVTMFISPFPHFQLDSYQPFEGCENCYCRGDWCSCRFTDYQSARAASKILKREYGIRGSIKAGGGL